MTPEQALAEAWFATTAEREDPSLFADVAEALGRRGFVLVSVEDVARRLWDESEPNEDYQWDCTVNEGMRQRHLARARRLLGVEG